MSDTLPVPLVPGMIHRTDVPRHMMRISPAGRRIVAKLGDAVLADSVRALRVVEIGQDLYPPLYYLPAGDVVATFMPTDHTTHCPLKGDTAYHDVQIGEHLIEELAWEYSKPLPQARELAGHIAFDPARVTIVDAPLDDD